MAIFLKIVLCICFIYTTNAFWSNRKKNCLVTRWGSWSSPDENGQQIRTRKILRLPANGGLPCPHIREVKDNGCYYTRWTRWSRPFGFGQISRTRDWTDNLRPGLHVISTYGCKNVLEEDIRYTGNEPSFLDTGNSVYNNVVNPLYPSTPVEQVGKVRDIVLILDSSGSVTKTNFNQAKEDARTLFSLMCPKGSPFDVDAYDDYQHHQLAMLTFSTTVEENFFFNTHKSTDNVLDAIRSAKYFGSGTNTAGAFRKAKEMFENNRGARKSTSAVKQEVLILTDGLSNEGGDAVAAAKDLSKVADVYGFIIGKFSASGMAELTQYVSKPASSHLFSLEKFNIFSKLVYNLTKMSEKAGKNWCAGFDF